MMKLLLSFSRFAFLIGISTSIFTAEGELPSVETIIDKWIEVTGGKDAIQKIENRVTEGEAENSNIGGMITDVVRYFAKPAKAREFFNMNSVDLLPRGSDGQKTYGLDNRWPPRVYMRWNRIDLALCWKELYTKGKVQEMTNIQKEDCFKVAMYPPEEKPEYWYFSKISGDLLRLETRSNDDKILLVSFSDFKNADNLKIPHKITIELDGHMEELLTINRIKHNVKLSDWWFDIPSRVNK